MKHFGKKLWDAIECILKFLFCNILQLNISDEKWANFMQFVKFGIVGLSNTVVSYAVYLVGFFLLQQLKLFPIVDYLIAQFIGFVISVLWSFVLNRKFVFQADNESVPWLQALLKTYASYAFTGLFLNSLLSILWVEWLGISKLIAPIFNLLLSVPINFVLNKFWAFKSKKSS